MQSAYSLALTEYVQRRNRFKLLPKRNETQSFIPDWTRLAESMFFDDNQYVLSITPLKCHQWAIIPLSKVSWLILWITSVMFPFKVSTVYSLLMQTFSFNYARRRMSCSVLSGDLDGQLMSFGTQDDSISENFPNTSVVYLSVLEVVPSC